MSTVKNYDWKEHARHVKAAGVQPQPSTLEIERAFMDQAWSHIEPKAGKLMDDPFRLGFEIVAKKEGNTKLCGMFAFRLNGELLYAPTFFLNGQIKGTDLLYFHAAKKFKPFTEDWVTWSMDRAQANQGVGIDRSEARRHRPTDIHFERIAYPPNMHKYAAAGQIPGIDMSWDEWIKESTTVVNDLRLNLQSFLQNEGRGWATEKVASLIQTSPHFAQAIHRRFGDQWESLFGPESWEPQTKSASAAKLILHRDSKPGMTDEQIQAFYKRGYYVEDARPEDAMTIVYESSPRDIEEFSEPCLGEVMLSKGEFVKAIVLPECSESIGSKECSENSLNDSAFEDHDDGEKMQKRVIAIDGGKSCRVDRWADPVMGKVMKNLADCVRDEEDFLLEKPSSGNAYVMVDLAGGICSSPFFVTSTSSRGDITSVKLLDGGSGYEKELVMNPAFERTSITRAIAGTNARFIKVPHEGSVTLDSDDGYCRGVRIKGNDLNLGSAETINDWIFNQGSEMKKLAVSLDHHEEVTINYNGTVVRNLDRMGAFSKLAGQLAIASDTAEEILDEVFEKGASQRVLEEPAMAKFAGARLQLNDKETFYTGSNDVFGVDQEFPQSFLLNTDAFGQAPEPHRIGDAYDPTLGSGRGNRRGGGDVGGIPEAMLFGASPEMLADFSEQEQLPQVFDHGVIGSLTGTYDSGSMIDNFLDDLETALDRLGRILFLLYWKPADFEKDYGTDDMQNLENELLSTFKGYGDLVLNLLKKAKGRNEPANVFSSMG